MILGAQERRPYKQCTKMWMVKQVTKRQNPANSLFTTGEGANSRIQETPQATKHTARWEEGATPTIILHPAQQVNVLFASRHTFLVLCGNPVNGAFRQMKRVFCSAYKMCS